MAGFVGGISNEGEGLLVKQPCCAPINNVHMVAVV